jgi:hypothetical protein
MTIVIIPIITTMMLALAPAEEPHLLGIELMKITNERCVQEQFTCFFNNLLRLNHQPQMSLLKPQFETLCKNIFLEDHNNKRYANLLYSLILYVRDINGLGRYTQSYLLVTELYKFGMNYGVQVAQEAAYVIFEHFVKHYGSWKDVKYFLNYYVEELEKDKQRNDLGDDVLIHKIVKLVCKHLKEDTSHTLIAKWLPREKSVKFGWIMPIIAREYYREWFSDTINAAQYKAATRKALTHFRQLLSSLNKELQTTQIYQCNNTWSQINFKNVTKRTMHKQENAFNGTNKQFNHENDNKYKDRLECKRNFYNYNETKINETKINETTTEPTNFNSWDTILQIVSKYAELNN